MSMAFVFHVLAMLSDTMAMLSQVVVAPRSTIAAHNVDFAIGVSQLDQQIVKKIKLLHVIVFSIAGAVVAEKMVQFRDALGKILIAYAVDHIDMFTGMKVIETQPVARKIRAQCDPCARNTPSKLKQTKNLARMELLSSQRPWH